MTTTPMSHSRRWLAIGAGVMAAGVAAALVFTPTSGAAADSDEPPPISAVLLTTDPGHNEFTDDVAVQVRDKPSGRSTTVNNLRDASNIAVGEFTVQPGAWFPWHTHPGTGLIAVAQGDLVFIYSDDCIKRPYRQGEAFVDPGIVHTAYNPSHTATVVIATFIGAPADAPLATAVDAAEAREFNEQCGTDAPVPDEHDH